MQWFIRTTDDLRERIEQIYRLESALRRVDNLAADVESMSQRIEKDLRPSKVQHEMRLRALEPLLEQIEDTDNFRADVQGQLDQSATEIKNLRQEFTALRKISAAKNEKFFEQTITELNGVRVEMEELKKKASTIEPPKVEPPPEPEPSPEPTIDPRIDSTVEEVKTLRAELDALTQKISEPPPEPTIDPKVEQTVEDVKAIRSELDTLKQLAEALAEKANEPLPLDDLNRIAEQTESRLSAKDEEIKQLWQLFSERIEAKEAEIAQLKAQTNELLSQLETRDGAINELIRQIDYLWKKFDDVDARFEQHKEPPPPPPKVEPKAIIESVSTPSEEVPKILLFEIEPQGEVYINGTPDEITTRLKASMNVEELKAFLDGSKAANKVIFLRSLERHVRNLQKLTYKLNFNEYEGGRASEEITKKFFEIFKLTLLESVTATAYRGLGRQFEFYREFVRLFNRYLQRCGLYTRRVMPNGRVTDQDRVDMKIVERETANAANDNLIAEVERLPYYIDYIDPNGATQKIFFEGKMIVYGLAK